MENELKSILIPELKRWQLPIAKQEIKEMLDILPIGIAFSTQGAKGRIIYVNLPLVKLFGYDSKEEILKQPASALYFDPKERKRLAKMRKEGPVKDYETRFKRKDGSLFWGSVSSIPQKIRAKKLLFIDVFEDITERKCFEERLKQQQTELKARTQIINSILETFDLDDRLQTILNEIMEFLKVEMGAIYLLSGNDLILRKWKGLPDRLRFHLSSLPVENKNYLPPKSRVLHERLNKKGKIFDFAKKEGIQALAILPIKIKRYSLIKKRNKIYNLGTIILASRKYDALSQEEMTAIEGMAEQLALAIDHSVTFHQARQRLVRLEVLREIDRAILSNLHIKEILKIIVSSVPKELGADAAAVSLLNGEKSKTKVFTIKFPNGTIIEEEAFSIADSLLHWYVDRQKPVVIYDLSQDPRIQMHHKYLHKNKLCSYLGVPLVIEGKTIGVIHILTCLPKVFMTEDIEFFQTLAGQAAIALNSAQLFEQLRQSEEKFYKMAANATDAIILIDDKGRISFWNQAAEKIFGYPSPEAIGKECARLTLPNKLRKYFRKSFEQFASTGEASFLGQTFEVKALKEDGTQFPAEISASRLKLDNRWYLLEIIRDLSEYKKYEEKLKIKDMAIDSSLNAVVLADLKGVVSYVNPAFLEMWGYEKTEEVLGKSVLDFWQEKEKAKKGVRELKTHGKWEGDLVALRKDGSIFYVRGGASLIKGENKMPILMVASFIDITQLEKKKEELRQNIAKLKATFIEMINSMTTAIESRDAYTAGHQQRVAQLACAIAKKLDLSEEKIEGLMMACLIHDIGKISVPSEILNKPSKLTEAEFMIIKTHPRVGYEILKHIDFPWPVALTILQHHERINGSGYPQGLSGKDVLFEAKIMAVADVVEAMSSHRPYRPALGITKALAEIKKQRNILYEAKVVDTCLDLFLNKGFKFE